MILQDEPIAQFLNLCTSAQVTSRASSFTVPSGSPLSTHYEMFESQLKSSLDALVTRSADEHLVRFLAPVFDRLLALLLWRPPHTPDRHTGTGRVILWVTQTIFIFKTIYYRGPAVKQRRGQ